MSSIPREALNTKASKPGVIGVPSSVLSALARAITSCGSEMSAGVILFMTSAATYPSMRSAPTLKIWMTPFASVAMLEKLALLKIAFCRAPVLSKDSWRPASVMLVAVSATGSRMAESRIPLGMDNLSLSVNQRWGASAFERTTVVTHETNDQGADGVTDERADQDSADVQEIHRGPPSVVRIRRAMVTKSTSVS